MEAELKRMNTLLEEIVRHQRNRDRPNQVRKPRILPISSIREMDAFEGATDDIFFDTVSRERKILHATAPSTAAHTRDSEKMKNLGEAEHWKNWNWN
ncbi:uncharacterized protein LOC105279247 [Ooceraea biroi]|uniref:uncharacterized protein LOC105279247 n=1 Tax=Ooceraea biroi TaxID=2015173 RepID=UPI000F0945E0|nr:uncharacterized protein LOC105279247 [Ooceraea biroi]